MRISLQRLTKTHPIHICHLSSVHFALDTRIFYRMCRFLSQTYRVSLIAVHDKDEITDGIHIIPFRRYHNRKLRILTGWIPMFFKAIGTGARVFHLHDPELIPCGILLRLLGKKVILDIHENIAEDIFDKPWIKNQKRIYAVFSFFERLACRYFYILLAEASYEKRYKALGAKYAIVQNYCDTDFFATYVKQVYQKNHNVYYIGILLENRGVLQICDALNRLRTEGHIFHFHCVGELYSDLDSKIKALPFYPEIKDQLHFYGRLPLDRGYSIAAKMDIGLCIIWPMKNSMESYPTKLFEYMSCGLPVISSRFPLYKTVIEENGCGICIDPLDPEELKNAILSIHMDVEKSELMGKNGKKAVFEKYNWESQTPLLAKVYDMLTTQKQ